MTALGRKPVLKWLPVAKLTVDPKYQRDTTSRRSRNLIEKIAAEFQWSRFGVVLAVRHEKGWHVIGGQHRVEAARARDDVRDVPALILPHATVEAAAADFVAINRDRVTVTPLNLHYAMLAAGDPKAVAVDRACRAAGVEICRYAVPLAKLPRGKTVAVSSVARLVRLKDEAFASRVLKELVREGGAALGVLSASAIKYRSRDLGLNDRATARRRPQRGAGFMRPCLGCGTSFPSEGKHNRLCDSCNNKARRL